MCSTSVQTKKEEEEFNTGPLSVLMMSVKNNTQVCNRHLVDAVDSQYSFMVPLFQIIRWCNFLELACASVYYQYLIGK